MMSHRLIVIAMVVAPYGVASASELDLSAGGGATVVYSDPCGFPGEQCTTPRTRLAGASAVLRTSWSLRHAFTPRLSMRYGAALSGLFMTDTDGSGKGAIVTGGGEVGMTFDRWSGDLFAGWSVVHVHTDMTSANGPTMAFGGAIGFKLTTELSAFARLDLSAAPEGPIGGAFAGAGLTYHL